MSNENETKLKDLLFSILRNGSIFFVLVLFIIFLVHLLIFIFKMDRQIFWSYFRPAIVMGMNIILVCSAIGIGIGIIFFFYKTFDQLNKITMAKNISRDLKNAVKEYKYWAKILKTDTANFDNFKRKVDKQISLLTTATQQTIHELDNLRDSIIDTLLLLERDLNVLIRRVWKEFRNNFFELLTFFLAIFSFTVQSEYLPEDLKFLENLINFLAHTFILFIAIQYKIRSANYFFSLFFLTILEIIIIGFAYYFGNSLKDIYYLVSLIVYIFLFSKIFKNRDAKEPVIKIKDILDYET